jgi:hypothetical protein
MTLRMPSTLWTVESTTVASSMCSMRAMIARIVTTAVVAAVVAVVADGARAPAIGAVPVPDPEIAGDHAAAHAPVTGRVSGIAPVTGRVSGIALATARAPDLGDVAGNTAPDQTTNPTTTLVTGGSVRRCVTLFFH